MAKKIESRTAADASVVWIQNPFDSLPLEGARKMRYWLMAEAFVRAGWRVVYWTSDFSHATKTKRVLTSLSSLPSLSSLDPARFQLHLIPTKPYARNVSWARVASHRAYAQTWRRLAEDPALPRPDVIVASLPTLSGAAAALEIGRRLGAKVVLDIQDAWPETFERLAPKGLRWAAHLALTPLRHAAQRLYRAADVVTGVSARYRALSGRPDFHLAYHGIELGGSPTPNSTRQTTTSPLRLVYSGNLGRTYDLATIVKMVEAHEDMTLDVAGFGAFTSICPRIRFHGFLAEADLQRLFATCDIGLVPMPADSWVGLPNKFADYSRAGLRIVSSLGGESSALLEKYGCGATYRVGDAASLAAAVARAATLPRTASLRLCAEEFDARRIYDVYVACVGPTLRVRGAPSSGRRHATLRAW